MSEPLPQFGGIYDTGTATVANGQTTVVGVNTLWLSSKQVEVGDFYMQGGSVGFINSITDDTHIELRKGWAGTLSNSGEYDIIKMSWLRYFPALVQAKVRDLLTKLATVGFFYNVAGTAPDVSVGNDGDYALKVNVLPWTLWLKQGGLWILQGTPAGVKWRGTWDSATSYVVGDLVQSGGISYICISPNTNQTPPNATYWDLFAIGGDRYDVTWFDSDRPASGEIVVKCFPNGVQFKAGLVASAAGAEVAATAQTVFSITKNGVQFATLTFNAGANVGTFACAANTSFGLGDVLRVIAPNPRDATLSGVAATLIGYR
jgi:hypothetical protein